MGHKHTTKKHTYTPSPPQHTRTSPSPQPPTHTRLAIVTLEFRVTGCPDHQLSEMMWTMEQLKLLRTNKVDNWVTPFNLLTTISGYICKLGYNMNHTRLALDFFNLQMPSRQLHYYGFKGGASKQKKKEKRLTITTIVINCLIQAFTAVLGIPSSEERSIDTYAYLEIALNPFTLEKVLAWISLL